MMNERRVSRTAEGVAMLRAAHLRLDGEPRVFVDALAERLVDEETRRTLVTHPHAYRTPASRGLRAHVLARSRFAEERLEAAVARGVRQYVLLGAGLDSFAHRQPAWAREVSIFEVDHPASQQDKRNRLARAGLTETPVNLRQAAIDFADTPLAAGLAAVGFEAARPAFLSCLGVLVYLEPAAVMGIFDFVATLPTSSEIAFTYSGRRDEPRSRHRAALAEHVAAVGEPFRSETFREDLDPALRARGFQPMEELTPEAGQRYFGERSDGLAAPRTVKIAAARR